MLCQNKTGIALFTSNTSTNL